MSVDASETQALELVQNSIQVSGPFTTKLLSGGCSGSAVIKVSTPEKSYVVRFWNMKWVEYFPQDLACQLIASDAGYGPKVYFSDEAQGITIMDYYSPVAFPETEARLEALVNLLKKIHGGPVVPQGIERSPYLDVLIQETKETHFFDREALRVIKETVFFATGLEADCVACHRDLHHGNVLYTEDGYRAIDYTWGAMDDPYVDLANAAIFNCTTEEEEKVLLKLYLGRAPTPKEMARLSLVKVSVKMLYGLEFWGIACSQMNGQVVLSSISRAYREFGMHGGRVSTPADFATYATRVCG